jgi:hypothetical protein
MVDLGERVEAGLDASVIEHSGAGLESTGCLSGQNPGIGRRTVVNPFLNTKFERF